MKNNRYIKPDMNVMELEVQNGFLKGSITDVKIRISQVTVEPFENGFSDLDGGFKNISFD